MSLAQRLSLTISEGSITSSALELCESEEKSESFSSQVSNAASELLLDPAEADS